MLKMEYSWVRGISPGYILLVLLFIYLFGMDIMLYFRIQDYPLRKDNVNTTDYPANCNEISPFCYVSVKGVMLDQINEYIFGPAITIFDMIFRISDIKFITPNMISFFHVFVAIVSGKCVSSHLIWTRRLGVVLFEIRTLLDDLDGHVARKRKHVHGETSEIGSTGYIVDGVCDLLGVSFFMLGVLIFLKNNPSRRDYTPVVDKTDFTEAYRKKITNRRLYQVIACVSIQLTLSSIAWNRYIALYQDLLERPRVSQILEFKELLVFRSNYFLLIAFLWRILNVHSYLHVILLAVVLDKVSELFKNIKLIGFVVLLALICLTEMHILLVEEFFYESNFIYRNVTAF